MNNVNREQFLLQYMYGRSVIMYALSHLYGWTDCLSKLMALEAYIVLTPMRLDLWIRLVWHCLFAGTFQWRKTAMLSTTACSAAYTHTCTLVNIQSRLLGAWNLENGNSMSTLGFRKRVHAPPPLGKTRNEQRKNGKWEVGNDGNGRWKNGHNCISSKHSATELAVTMKNQDYKLAVVLQPSLLCWGEDQLFVTKSNGKAT